MTLLIIRRLLTSRGLLIGRFQPPHLGHLSIIKDILKSYDEIIIVVAAAQISHTMKNPLTAGERLTLIQTMLKNSKMPMDKIWLLPAQDILDNSLWVYHIKRLVPPFDVFYGNNPFTTILFQDANIEVKNTILFDRELFEGSIIRNKIMNGEDISKAVDRDVLLQLGEWNVQARLQAANKENPTGELV